MWSAYIALMDYTEELKLENENKIVYIIYLTNYKVV